MPQHPPISTLLPASWLRGRRIGLMGGSFNPPHAGHRHIAEEAIKRLRLDEVWWLLARHNPLKPADIYADHAQRLEQTQALARHPRFRVLDIEWQLGISYTFDLLQVLHPLLRQGRCVWIMGADSFAGLHHWKRWREVAAMIPLAVFDRPGATLAALTCPAARLLRHARLPQRAAARLPETTPPAWAFLSIPRNPESSTHLRALAAAGQDAKEGDSAAPVHHQAKNVASQRGNGA